MNSNTEFSNMLINVSQDLFHMQALYACANVHIATFKRGADSVGAT